MQEFILYTFFINLLNNTHFEYKSRKQDLEALALLQAPGFKDVAGANHPGVFDPCSIFMQIQAFRYLTRIFQQLTTQAANRSALTGLCSASAGPIPT